MRFRTRLLVMLTATVVLPVILLSWLVRENMTARLQTQHRASTDSMVSSVQNRIQGFTDRANSGLRSLITLIGDDNRLRQSFVAYNGSPRSIDSYLIDFSERYGILSGLNYFQIQDKSGVVLSSAHFRNEFGRIDESARAFPGALSGNMSKSGILEGRTPDGPVFALARPDSILIAGKQYYVLAGFILDTDFFSDLSPASDVFLCMDISPDTEIRQPSNIVACDSSKSKLIDPVMTPALDLMFVSGRRETVARAEFFLVSTLTDLDQLLSDLDRWFLSILGIILALGFISIVWVSGKISEPLSELLYKTTRIDLNRLNISFKTARSDEVGDLSRVLDELMRRLKRDAASLREAERRLAFGELARQVNHDIKNALAPIRNIVRHYSSLAYSETGHLAEVVRDREKSLDESILYLEQLAGHYARLSPEFRLVATDLDQLISRISHEYSEASDVQIELNLAAHCIVDTDPIAFRRILDNILDNAFDSLIDDTGSVSITTEKIGAPDSHTENAPLPVHDLDDVVNVRIVISDTGKGMSPDDVNNAFKDFYTSKTGGTGLGLSIVRRLVMDLKGSVSIDSSENTGTSVTIIIPARRR